MRRTTRAGVTQVEKMGETVFLANSASFLSLSFSQPFSPFLSSYTSRVPSPSLPLSSSRLARSKDALLVSVCRDRRRCPAIFSSPRDSPLNSPLRIQIERTMHIAPSGLIPILFRPSFVPPSLSFFQTRSSLSAIHVRTRVSIRHIHARVGA